MIVNIKAFQLIIDDEDFDKIIQDKTWSLKYHHAGKIYFHRHIKVNGKWKHESLHRTIVNAIDKQTVDHINGNTLDNRKCNLRICTTEQNNINHCIQKNNTTGYKGVRLDKRSGKYEARISLNRKRKQLGTFDTAEEAYRAYCNASKEYHQEFARVIYETSQTSNSSSKCM
jgi:hypothetical protein